ncbi:hypothetical protein [Silvimonas sp.]|uniref:hypothetical protein n=1 Tax=Silvimonas sp. TaxID=2650811 RepID=UPI00284EE4AC|nr:hypothetical protein [Silvimonas sp.]MDR3428994.1 hypothetical protein [Silvimonas sp.]
MSAGQLPHTEERHNLEFTIRYGLCLNARHKALYGHLRQWFSGLSLLFGMGALAFLTGDKGWLGTIAGVSIAVIVVLDNQIDPAGKVHAFAGWHRRWGKLFRRLGEGEALDAIGAGVAKLQGASSATLQGLTFVAYNDAALEMGLQPDKLTLWQRFLAVLA